LIYQIEKSLRDLGDKAPAADRSRVDDKIKSLREAMTGDDAGRIRRAMDELQQAAVTIGQAMYGQAGAGGQPQAGHTPGGNGQHGQDEGENVVEGEFRQV